MNIFHSSKVFHKKEKFTGIWAWTHAPPSPPMCSPSVWQRSRNAGVTSRYIWKIIFFTADYISAWISLADRFPHFASWNHSKCWLGAMSAIYCQTVFSWPSPRVCWPSLRCWSPPPPPSTPRQKADWPKASQGQWDPVMKTCDSAANVENIKTLEIGSTPAFSRSLKRR